MTFKFKIMIKDIPGYENYYSIDTEGNVYSKDRIITQINPKTKQPMTYLKKGRKLCPAIKGNGYYGVCLMVNGIGKYIPIHRLLAITFIPNPDNLPCINHKDENKLNNNISNLEWCTPSYNTCYSLHKASFKIMCNGIIYPSIKACARALNIDSKCIRYRLKVGGVYKGKYKFTLV